MRDRLTFWETTRAAIDVGDLFAERLSKSTDEPGEDDVDETLWLVLGPPPRRAVRRYKLGKRLRRSTRTGLGIGDDPFDDEAFFERVAEILRVHADRGESATRADDVEFAGLLHARQEVDVEAVWVEPEAALADREQVIGVL